MQEVATQDYPQSNSKVIELCTVDLLALHGVPAKTHLNLVGNCTQGKFSPKIYLISQADILTRVDILYRTFLLRILVKIYKSMNI